MFSLITGWSFECADPSQTNKTRSEAATRKRRLRGFQGLRVFPANFAKLAALEDRVDRRGETVVAIGKTLLHLRDERLVGELKTAAERITQKFTAELVNKGVAPSHSQVVSQA